jgi:ribose transport system substrate-binding protein
MRTTAKLLSLTVPGVLFLALAGCGGSSAHAPTENYVLVADNIKVAYWQAAAAGIKQAATDLGVKYEVAGSETHDAEAERKEFRRILNRTPKPTGIMVSAADAELLKGEIDAAIGQGVPVVTVDSDSPTSKRLFFIGTENYRAGTMGAQVVVKQLQGRGNVVVFTIPGQANLAQRLRGYQETFAAHPGIKIVQTIDMKGDAGTAFDAAKDILEGGKVKADAFVCLEAIACAQVADVMNRNQITGKLVVAMDTDESTLGWIKKGLITATIAQKPYTMAYVGLQMLDLLEHYKLTNLSANHAENAFAKVPSFVDTGATLITKDNVDSFQPLGPPPAPAK